MPPTKPRKRTPSAKRLRMLDIGHGEAQRIARYARRARSKNRFFYGMEKERQFTFVPSRQHNVKLMIGDAEAKLRKLPSRSLDVVNMDFFDLTEASSKIDGFTKQGMPKIRVSTKVLFPTLLKEVKRVLDKNGRLFLTVQAGAVGDIDALLGNHDFIETRFFDVPENQKNATTEMRKHFELAKTKPSARPVRFIAVKRG